MPNMESLQPINVRPALIGTVSEEPRYQLVPSYVNAASPNTVFTSYNMVSSVAAGEVWSDTNRFILTLCDNSNAAKPISIANSTRKQSVAILQLSTDHTQTVCITAGSGAGIPTTADWQLSSRYTPIIQTYNRTTLTWNILNTLSTGTVFGTKSLLNGKITNSGAGVNINVGAQLDAIPLNAGVQYAASTPAFKIYGFIVDVKFTSTTAGPTTGWGRTISGSWTLTGAPTAGTPTFKGYPFVALYDSNAT